MSDRRWDSNMLDLASFGFFLVSVGAAFVAVPDIVTRLSDFVADFTMVELSPNFFLPAPAGFHPQVYYALFIYSLVFGILHIPLLAGRLYFKDKLRKKASTVGSIVFILGSAYVCSLIYAQSVAWFGFIGLVIMLGGVGLVIENLIVLVVSGKR